MSKTKKIDAVKISYYFLDFCLQNFGRLFAPAIKHIDDPPIGTYRPDITIKELFGIEKDEPFNLTDLCNKVNSISDTDKQDELKLLASEIICDIFAVGFNSKRKDLDYWERFTLVKLSDFLQFMEIITADNTLRISFMHKYKEHVNELFGLEDSEKHFNFNNMTIQYAVSLITEEAEQIFYKAEFINKIYANKNSNKDLAKANALLRKNYELVKELIIDSCELCMNSLDFDCLIEEAELKGI